MRRIRGMSLGILVVTGLSGFLSAATVVVGTCKSGLPHTTTIQAAVDISANGGTVLVCPGNYPEQVSINKPLNVRGVQSGNTDAAVIVPPGTVTANASSLFDSSPIAAQVLVTGAVGVNLSNLTVDGKGNGITGCSPDFMGILYQNASGTVNHIVAINQKLDDPALLGCQSGQAIFFIQSGNNVTSNVTVENSHVQDYQKNGITGNEVGTTVLFTGNTVFGIGANDSIAQNSIQIGFGAQGKALSNTVGDDVFTPATFGGAGILVVDSSDTFVMGNTITNTQTGIGTFSQGGLAERTTIKNNRVATTRNFDGIDVCSRSNLVQGNTINGSDEAAINLDGSCDTTSASNVVRNNIINGACAGILDGGANTNTIGPNSFFNTRFTIKQGNSCTPPLASVNASNVPNKQLTTKPNKSKPAR